MVDLDKPDWDFDRIQSGCIHKKSTSVIFYIFSFSSADAYNKWVKSIEPLSTDLVDLSSRLCKFIVGSFSQAELFSALISYDHYLNVIFDYLLTREERNCCVE